MFSRKEALAKREAEEKRSTLITEAVKTCDEENIIGLLELRPQITESEKKGIFLSVLRKCRDVALIETVIDAFGIDLAKLHKSTSLISLFSANPAALQHFMTKEELIPLFKQGLKSAYEWDVMMANTGHNEPKPSLQPGLEVMKEFMDRHGIANTTHRNPAVRAQMGPGKLLAQCNKHAINEAIDRLKANPPTSKMDMHTFFNTLVSRCSRPDIGDFLGRFIDELRYVPDNVHTSFSYISENRNALKYLITRPDFIAYFKRHIPYAYTANIKHILNRSGPNISKPITQMSHFGDYQEFMKSQQIPFAQPNNYRRDRIAEMAKERLISRAERLALDEDRIVTRRLTYDQEQRAINAAISGRTYTRRAREKWNEIRSNPKYHNRRIDLNLFHAASKCDLARVRAAISAGASTTAIHKATGSIPLAFFITNCNVPLEAGMDFSEKNKELIELLSLGVNGDPEVLCGLDHFGRSLLELAIISGNHGMAYVLITGTDFVNLRPDIAQMFYDYAEGRVLNDFPYGTYYGKPISHIVSRFLKVKLESIPEEARRPADIKRVADAARNAAKYAPVATAVEAALAAAKEAMQEMPFEAKVTPESLTVSEYAEAEAQNNLPKPSAEVEAAIDATVAESGGGGGGGGGGGLDLNAPGLVNLSLLNNGNTSAPVVAKNNSFNALLARAAAKGITVPKKYTKKKYAARLKELLNAYNEEPSSNNNSSSNNNNVVNINTLGGRRTLKSKKRT